MIQSANYPTTPIDPKIFVVEVENVLQSMNVFTSKGSLSVLESLCGLLNYSITNPSLRPIANKNIWAFPAQTGVGKSVALQVYVSMLDTETSLIIVSKKEEARQYCDRINTLRNDPSYAKCLYAPSGKLDNHPCLVQADEEIRDAKCLIITHNRFIKLSQTSGIEVIRDYQPIDSEQKQKRALVVIDERLALHKVFQLKLSELKRLVVFIDKALKYSPDAQAICTHTDLAYPFLQVTDYLEQEFNTFDLIKYVDGHELFEWLDDQNSAQLDYDLLLKVYCARFNEICNELADLSNVSIESYANLAFNSVNSMWDQFQRIFLGGIQSLPNMDEGCYKNLTLFKANNRYLIRVANLYSRLGACVVLDATASFNAFYQFASKHAFSAIDLAPAPQIRKYQNLTIHKAKGFLQSRSAIYKSPEVNAQNNAKMYLSYAKSELSHPDDKMLIVCHKDFKPIIENLNKQTSGDTRIVFTHWGNHIGRNNWNDCNKVMIVGWNYQNPIQNVAKVLATARASEDMVLIHKITQDVLDDFEVSQMADDLVQAVMRCRARVIATADSDCLKASVYLLHPDNKKSNAVLALFESQFSQATVVDWIPQGLAQVKKKTKPQQKADKIIELLVTKSATHETYLRKEVENELGINKTTMQRILGQAYFKEQLASQGFDFKNKDGKSQQFILK